MDLHTEIRRQLERDPSLLSEEESQKQKTEGNSRDAHRAGPGKESTTQPEDPGRYCVEDGRICIEKATRDGEVLIIPLCNFTAQVKEELVLDNGADTTRAFVLAGALCNGELLPVVRVPVSRFAGMTWITEQWGFGAIVNAGQSIRDQLREAIQRLSPSPRRRRVFTHTGWHKVEGGWIFLTSSGAVDRDGYEVDLGPDLTRYALPRTPENPMEAMACSLRLLEIAPLVVTVPLLAAVFRAPLASVLPLDLSLWLEGFTGSLKSTIAALFLSHFGDFSESSLPGSWLSTVNQLERRAFILKDVPFVIDDYAPLGADARELEAKAGRILRAQGNLAARGRLRSDLTERPGFSPRGIIIGTGEQHPPGQSILARTLLLELERSAVDLSKLTGGLKTEGKDLPVELIVAALADLDADGADTTEARDLLRSHGVQLRESTPVPYRRRSNNQVSAETEALIRDLLDKRWTKTAIAKHLKINRRVVIRVAREAQSAQETPK